MQWLPALLVASGEDQLCLRSRDRQLRVCQGSELEDVLCQLLALVIYQNGGGPSSRRTGFWGPSSKKGQRWWREGKGEVKVFNYNREINQVRVRSKRMKNLDEPICAPEPHTGEHQQVPLGLPRPARSAPWVVLCGLLTATHLTRKVLPRR